MVAVARLRFIVLLVSTALGAAAYGAPPQHSTNSNKGIAYRWVDEQGVVHYGDNIPPQYASQDRAILNAQGVEVGHLDKQKTPEEEAVAARAREALMKQRQHDAFLVSTYTSVKDIEALRDARLDQLKAQRGAAEQYVESLRVRLGTLQSRALTYSPYSKDARRARLGRLRMDRVQLAIALDIRLELLPQCRFLASLDGECAALHV